MSEKWLSIVEYARNYNVSDMTVRRRIRTGKLKSIIKDGKYFILVAQNTSSLSCNNSYEQKNSQMINNPSTRFNKSCDSRIQNTDHISSSRVLSKPTFSYREQRKREEPKEVVESQLASFCERALKKLSDSEKWLEEKYSQQIESLNKQIELLQEKLSNKNEKEYALKQKIEDLQTLLQLIEQSKETSNSL